ncbi:MAG: hypothetical protein WBA31_08835 [Candidatus Dormiibacterota bacterium]
MKVAKQVYYGRDGLLWDCALSEAGAFEGYDGCPFTTHLRGELESFPRGDALACGSQMAQQAPYHYGVAVSQDGGVVQVAAFPGPPGISIPATSTGEVYWLTLVRRDGRLQVSIIQKQTGGTPGPPVELTTGC